MPYIITTATPAVYGSDHETRCAVATLEGARTEAYSSCFERTADDQYAACRNLPESGGSIGPLPDGTVIEVVPMPIHGSQPTTEREARALCDAFNAS